MPPKKRTGHHRRGPKWGPGHICQLKTGHSYEILGPTFGRPFGPRANFDEGAARAAWSDLRLQIIAECAAEKPCTRPAAWWWFEAPELRRRLDDGVHPCEGPDAAIPPTRGIPAIYFTEDHFRAMYESEPAYLLRLGLLTKAERSYLATHPDLLDPVSKIARLAEMVIPR